MIPAGYQSWAHPWTLVDRMRRKKKIIVHGDGTSLWTMTHNTDFAKGFVGLLGNPRAIGHAVHITSDEALTWDQIIATFQLPTTGAGQAILGSANVYTAAICDMTGNKPGNICNTTLIKQAQAELPKA